MNEITIQPFGVLLGFAIAGFFSGFGNSMVGLVTKYYIEPRIKKWRTLHKKLFKKIKNGKKVKGK